MMSNTTSNAAGMVKGNAETYLRQLNGEKNAYVSMIGGVSSQKELLETYDKLQKYLDEHKDLADDVVSKIHEHQKNIMSYIADEAKDAYDQEKNLEYYEYIDKKSDDYLDYKANLEKKQALVKKYNEAESKDQEQLYAKRMQELDEELQNVKNKLYDGANDAIKNQLDSEFLSMQVDTDKYLSPENYLQSRKEISDEEKQQIKDIEEELKKTGALSEESRQKLAKLKEELYKKENGETFVSQLNEDLGAIGNQSKINLDKNNLLTEYNKTQKDSDIQGKKDEAADILQDLYSYELGYTDQYLEKAGGHLTKIGDAVNADREKINQLQEDIKKLEEEEKTNISNWLNGINASLENLGVNTSAKWYNDLSEGLKNGEIDFETFYNTIATNCEKLGIDLNDLKKAFSGLDEELGMLGSQQQFLSEMGKIEDLYEKATKLKSGKSLDADKIVELRNEYQEVNDYIAETGDLTLKNGQLLMELGDEAYEKGESALEKQIETLEDYQDAILNTVDAMGIMAEFKEELAKLDSELAETITDNAIAEAKAEGMYVDFTKEAADGIYEAKESVVMANQNLYNSEQASIQGILDSKAIEAETEQAYADQTLAIDEAIQASDAATAEQKANSAQWVIDSKTTEGEVTAGVAEVEAGSESSSAQATAEGANSKADSQAVAAQAAITTGQAFIQMARAIAEAEGIETSGLDEAAGKLEGLQGRLDEIGAEKASNAQKAAAAYAEAQKKIKEAKARLGSYRGLNTQGHGGYNKAGGSGGGGSKNNYSSDDAAEDLKSILNDIEKYEQNIEADLEDQTTELLNHYNLERNKLDTLREELDYYDEIYDVTENTTKWLENQLKILDEESKKVAEMQNSNDKIYKQREKIISENSKYNVASWFDSEFNETLAYGDLLNSFEYQKEAIQKETAQKMRNIYNGVAGSTDKDTISDAKKQIKNIQDEAENRIKALDKEKTKVENIYKSVNELNDAWKENQEKIREALTELNNRVKSIRDELIDDIMEQLERAVDKMNTSIEKDVTRLEQLKDVQESYNDILNDTIDTQQELDDELRANMDTYQYLDETMRQLMFNEDDYKQLSKVLEGVQQDIADIWEDHYNQIQNLTEDEMYKAEYITAETERQLAAKQKEYDLAKAELDVAKAQTNLQNVLNERNTRVFANGEWSWVANPDNVKSARQQVADAEREKTRLEREKEQQKLIDSMDRIIDSDNLQIDKNNDLLEKIQEAIERETEEVKSVEEALLNADKANLPALTTTLVGALGSDGGYMKELLGEINHSQVELAAALRGQTIEQAVNQLKSGSMSKSDFNELVSRLGYSFNETTGEVTTQDGTFAAHYAGWTKKSNADKQLTTAPNGVQVTGNQNSSSTTSIASAEARAQNNNLEQIAREVWLGKWGNGADRKRRLEAAGYNYSDVQALVNKGRNYFFDQGGLATGLGSLSKDTILPERVLSPRQTKAFENLVTNLTTNPVLNALSKVPSISSKLGDLSGETNNSKNYYFRDFTVKADDIEQFISSIETMMPIKK